MTNVAKLRAQAQEAQEDMSYLIELIRHDEDEAANVVLICIERHIGLIWEYMPKGTQSAHLRSVCAPLHRLVGLVREGLIEHKPALSASTRLFARLGHIASLAAGTPDDGTLSANPDKVLEIRQAATKAYNRV